MNQDISRPIAPDPVHPNSEAPAPLAGEPETPDPQALAEAASAAMWRNDAASQGLGMRLLRVAPGEADMSMTVEPYMLNGHGSCHGGFLFALADSAFAFACNSFNQRTVAQACGITYLRPGRAGSLLTACARLSAQSGRSGVYDVRISDAAGEVVALFQGQSREIGGSVTG
jgi:acyl-CoA thioesterase